MSATELLATRVTPDIKERVAGVAGREFLTESIWLRRLVLRELQAISSELAAKGHSGDDAAPTRNSFANRAQPSSGLFVRLPREDRLLLKERAAARGMASATYAAVLLRSHLRSLPPMPKDELVAFKRAISELGAVGRNLNQIARAANSGARAGGISRDELRALLKICEALRDHMKGLVKSNAASWRTGHD